MTRKYAEKIIQIVWIVSLVGIIVAILRPYMDQAIDTGVLMNYMPWLFPGQLYFDYILKVSLLTFMLFMKSRLGAILLLLVFISDKLLMLISLHGFETIYIYTWLITQFIYTLIFMLGIWATFAYRHRITASSPDVGTVAKDLKSQLQGKMPLKRAFWAYVGGGFVAIFTISDLFYLPVVGTSLDLLSMAIFFVYVPVACVGMWRSASAYTGKRIWSDLAKLGAVLIPLLVAYSFYSLIILYSEEITSTMDLGSSTSKQGTWNETLEARDFDGNPTTVEGYYDTQLDITWLADANYAKTNGNYVDGKMTWRQARKWVDSLDINGITGWRLPSESPINGETFNLEISYDGTTDSVTAPTTTNGMDGGWRDISRNPVSEMGNLYYVTLGNEHGYPGPGITNTGPFINIQTADTVYWSDGEAMMHTIPVVLVFDFHVGYRDTRSPEYSYNVWPVHDGDIGKAIQVSSPITYYKQ